MNRGRAQRRPAASDAAATIAAARTTPNGSGSVLSESRFGTSPEAQFKAVLRSIEPALASGDAAVALSGAKLNVLILALRKAIWVEEEVVPRDLYAFSALNDAAVSPDERLRTVANRMLRRADGEPKQASVGYPTRRIVAEYRALTGQGAGDTSFYFSRQLCGLSRQADDFEPITLPLSPDDALTAIQSIHRFPSRRAVRSFVRAAIDALPKRQRPLPPAAVEVRRTLA
ncbi:MAG: hypothetical protein ABI629_13455 [bacterium]